jgi:hypothetical protein
MKPKFHFFSDAEHRKQCKRAGCKHPAIYNMTEFKAQGWCDLCRALVFGPKQKKGKPPQQTKDEPIIPKSVRQGAADLHEAARKPPTLAVMTWHSPNTRESSGSARYG